MSYVCSPAPSPQLCPVWARAGVWGDPRERRLTNGEVTEGSLGGRAVLLRRDEGLAPLDGGAQCSKSTGPPLPQGTEMAQQASGGAGGGGGGGLLVTALRVNLVCGAGAPRVSGEKAGERRVSPAFRDMGPRGSSSPEPPLPAQCSPQRVALTEAKFTFLCGARGCVQSLGLQSQE